MSLNVAAGMLLAFDSWQRPQVSLHCPTWTSLLPHRSESGVSSAQTATELLVVQSSLQQYSSMICTHRDHDHLDTRQVRIQGFALLC